MRSKLTILFILLSGLIFGQSVPNTNTFTLDSVVAVVGGTSLTDCFSRAVDADFDATYVGVKDRLSNFRNYTIPTGTATSGKWITAVVNGGYIYRSNDYGVTWLQVGTSQYWWGVSMDTTGMYQAAVANGGYIYESNDFGVTWAQRGSVQSWSAIAVSGNGVYQTAVAWSGYIYTSSDYGNTWTQRATDQSWRAVDVSPSGQYQIAAVSTASTTGYIYISTDYGATWTAATGIGLKTWNGVYVSSGGSVYYAVDGNNGLIWHSPAVDSTWYTNATYYTFGYLAGNVGYNYSYWRSISGDYAGTYIIAGNSNGNITYKFATSTLWRLVDNSGDWSVQSGYTGNYMVAAKLYGYLYVSTDHGVTWVIINSTGRSYSGIATN